jgi:hypothetical protein
MTNPVTIKFEIEGDGRDGAAAVKQVVDEVKNLTTNTERSTDALNDAGAAAERITKSTGSLRDQVLAVWQANVDAEQAAAAYGNAQVKANEEAEESARKMHLLEVAAFDENERRLRDQLVLEVSAHEENQRRLRDRQRLESEAHAEDARRTEAARSRFESLSRSATDALKKVAAVVITALGIRQLGQLGLQALRTADQIGNMARQTGVSTETLSVFTLAAERSNVEIGAVGKGLQQLAKSLAEVEEGNVATANTFAAIGLDAKELTELPLDEAFLKIATALDQYADGANKNVVAQRLLGISGAQLIPVMQSLAGDGFAEVSKEAERLGRVVGERDVRAAEDFTRAITGMRSQLGALSSSFISGAVTGFGKADEDIEKTTENLNTLREDLRAIGEIAGEALRPVADLFRKMAEMTAEEKRRDDAQVESIKRFGRFVRDLFVAGNKSAVMERFFGTPQQVRTAADVARETALSELNTTILELRRRGQEVADVNTGELTIEQIKRRNAQLTDQLSRTIILQTADLAAVLKAQSDARLAALDRELVLVRERNQQLLAASAASFEQGTTSLQAFFDARRTVIREEGEAEVTAAKQRVEELQESLRTALATGAFREGSAEAVTARKDIADAENQVLLANLQLEGQMAGLTNEEIEKRRELGQMRLQFEQQLLALQGRVHEASLSAIAQQAADFTRELTKAGLAAEEVQAKVTAFREAATTQANLAELQRRADLLSLSIEQNQQRINLQVESGAITMDEATVAQNNFVASQQTAASTLVAAFTAMKTGITDPAILASIDGMILKLQGVEQAGKSAQTQLQLLGSRVLQGGGQALLGFLDEMEQRTFTFEAAFRNMARSIIRLIGDIAQQWLVLKAVQGIAGSFGLPVPKGFALGGPVPGSGNRDSVPAMLTPGEYVLNRRMVGEMGGTSSLERLRRALRGPRSFVQGGIGHFAGGGPVAQMGTSAAGGTGSEHRVVLEVTDEVVARVMESSRGGQIIVRQSKKNRHALAGVMGAGPGNG